MHPPGFSKEDKSPPTLIPPEGKTVCFCKTVQAFRPAQLDSRCFFMQSSIPKLQFLEYKSLFLPNKAVIMEESPGESRNNARPAVRFDLLIKPSVSNPPRQKRTNQIRRTFFDARPKDAAAQHVPAVSAAKTIRVYHHKAELCSRFPAHSGECGNLHLQYFKAINFYCLILETSSLPL